MDNYAPIQPNSKESLLSSPDRSQQRCRFGPREYVAGFLERLSSFIENAPGHMQRSNRVLPLSFNIGELFKREDMTISCIKWKDGLFYVSGTDIVKIVKTIYTVLTDSNDSPSKKFEEGVFSDLRNFKTGDRARLEKPRSEMLSFMHKNGCIRTMKKQRVFYWLFWADYIKLFEQANTRDTKRISIKTQKVMFSNIKNGIYPQTGLLSQNNSIGSLYNSPVSKQTQKQPSTETAIESVFFKQEETLDFNDIFGLEDCFLQYS